MARVAACSLGASLGGFASNLRVPGAIRLAAYGAASALSAHGDDFESPIAQNQSLCRVARHADGAGLAPWVVGGCGEAGTSRRQAVTMWEFSWLTRREGAEAEYADWDKVLDELAARGYDTIRMDAFPHLVARGPEGEQVDRFTILPQTPLFMWGNHAPVEVEPRAALVEFITKVRDRGMNVGLSTWFNDDSLHRAATVATPDDYARIWRETLDHLAGAECAGRGSVGGPVQRVSHRQVGERRLSADLRWSGS